MATSKSGGSTQNNRESHSKRLGCKLFDGHKVFGGEIIVRQRGTHIHPGKQVLRGGDDRGPSRALKRCFTVPIWQQ